MYLFIITRRVFIKKAVTILVTAFFMNFNAVLQSKLLFIVQYGELTFSQLEATK
jgi:hypothetical protein